MGVARGRALKQGHVHDRERRGTGARIALSIDVELEASGSATNPRLIRDLSSSDTARAASETTRAALRQPSVNCMTQPQGIQQIGVLPQGGDHLILIEYLPYEKTSLKLLPSYQVHFGTLHEGCIAYEPRVSVGRKLGSSFAGEPWPVTTAATAPASTGVWLPRQTTCRSGRSSSKS